MPDYGHAGVARPRSCLQSLLFVSILALAGQASAQVSVAPTALFIDSETRFATFTVRNGSDQVQEVAVEFHFGYPASDSAGRSVMIYDDSTSAAKYSMASWIRGFPRYFMLAPGQQQVIRLTVRPPHDLPDGMYWTRIRTISNPQGPVIAQGSTENVRARISFHLEQVTAGFYKKGRLTTGIEIDDLSVSTSDGGASLLTTLRRTGNAPFIGSVVTTLYDTGGNRVREDRTSTAIYFGGVRRIGLDLGDLPPGNYTAEVRYETQRNDIPRSDLVQAEPVFRRTIFRIQ